MKRIGLLGCGAIGTQIALAIDTGKIPGVLTHIYDNSKYAATELASKLNNKPLIVENSHLLSSNPIDIIVEAASQDAVKDVALSVLQNKRDLMIMSVGALLDESIYDVLSDACNHFKKTIYLPSGAIAGLDGLKSVKDELESVSITTTKHPRSLKGAKFFETSDINLDAIDSSTIIFEGTAKEAVSMFPANINVAALLSLCGIGSEKTIVKIIADPNTDKNTHHIEAKGKFGKMTFTIENFPDPNNPKTSRLAILSAIETLRKYCSDDIQIGT
ncbi:L-aspartate dehydrogenase [Nitrosopumilus zosterae]|uniref:L-aspartate dehydrogenase n=1 Tax=Nitrosopumilus zosterae TaxID=718286 RepID=A0A2S2KR05_9ARCH|nr:aspartate dehydrogenase [Nitrosopumilus zosterae]BDQ30477.1 aspartate dehydrogenase [Nitrosopumilus zosterae]GBH34089.1 L-aspartate dehydrogenase [Nitrosopumilus zosterae]